MSAAATTNLKRWFTEAANGELDHYALLGIERYEDDEPTIVSSVNAKLNYLQDISTAGVYVEQAQRLLNNVAKAKICLTNKKTKSAYDRSLQNPVASSKPIPMAKTVGAASVVLETSLPDASARTAKSEQGALDRIKAAKMRRMKLQRNRTLAIAGMSAICLAAIVGASVFFFMLSQKAAPSSGVISANEFGAVAKRFEKVNLSIGDAESGLATLNGEVWNLLAAPEAWELQDANGILVEEFYASHDSPLGNNSPQDTSGYVPGLDQILNSRRHTENMKREKGSFQLRFWKVEPNSQWNVEIYCGFKKRKDFKVSFDVNGKKVRQQTSDKIFKTHKPILVEGVTANEDGEIIITASGTPYGILQAVSLSPR